VHKIDEGCEVSDRSSEEHWQVSATNSASLVCCSVMQCDAVCCSDLCVLQSVAVCFSVVQRGAVR